MAAATVGVLTGLLANGSGFLLVQLYLVTLGLGMHQSAATNLVVIAALSVPTLAAHWALGNIDWAVAAAFAGGAVPVARRLRDAASIGQALKEQVTGSKPRVELIRSLPASGGLVRP